MYCSNARRTEDDANYSRNCLLPVHLLHLLFTTQCTSLRARSRGRIGRCCRSSSRVNICWPLLPRPAIARPSRERVVAVVVRSGAEEVVNAIDVFVMLSCIWVLGSRDCLARGASFQPHRIAGVFFARRATPPREAAALPPHGGRPRSTAGRVRYVRPCQGSSRAAAHGRKPRSIFSILLVQLSSALPHRLLALS
jgi:hypothetical protein